MSVTSGFYNSLNGDRRYNAEQMSAIFDGIINDGVFANIGNVFAVKANGGTNVTVDTGFAWFNSKWIRNDGILPIVLDASETVLDRIDAIIFDIDRSDTVRNGTIKYIKGSPASSPKRPEMISTDDHNQYPISFIYRRADTNEIRQADITNMVGTSSCPYITGILEVHNIDNIVAQWRDEWNQWLLNTTEVVDSESAAWISQTQAVFDSWFDSLQVTLEGDVAAQLAAGFVELQERFETLARERCVYSYIEDFADDKILDSNGLEIVGRTVLTFSGVVDGEVANFAEVAERAKIAERAEEATSAEIANTAYGTQLNDFYGDTNDFGGYDSLLSAVLDNADDYAIKIFIAQSREAWKDIPTSGDFGAWYVIFPARHDGNYTVLASVPRDTTRTPNVLYLRTIYNNNWKGEWSTIDWAGLLNGSVVPYMAQYVGMEGSESDSRLYIRSKTGSKDATGSIFLQTDTDAGVVNVGVGGSGAIGVNTAAKLKTARKIGNASFNGTSDITLAQMGALGAEEAAKSVSTDIFGVDGGHYGKGHWFNLEGNILCLSTGGSEGSRSITFRLIKKSAGSSGSPSSINGFTVTPTYSSNGDITAIKVNINGNAETASTLATPRKIGNASFDGSENITLSQIGAATSAQGTKADKAMPKSGGTFTGTIEVPLLYLKRTTHSIGADGNDTRYFIPNASGAHIFQKQGGAYAPVEANEFITMNASMRSNTGVLALCTNPTDKAWDLLLGGYDSINTLRPRSTNQTSLGHSSYRFNNLYLTNQPNVSSDEHQKNSIADVDKGIAMAFLTALRPSTFKLNNGESGRTHWGFISQQVEQAMTAAGLTDMDFAGFIRSPKTEEVANEDGTTEIREVAGEYEYSLRYGEFIPLLTSVIQNQQKEIEALKSRIEALEK